MSISRWARCGALAILALAAAVPASRVARAEPSAQEKQLARDLMKKGYQSRDAKDLKAALASFQAADEIMHVPSTGFEVARSHVDLGQLVEGRDALLRVLRFPEQAGEPKSFKEARDYARSLSEELSTRIPKLEFAVKGAASASVNVDGVAIPAVALSLPFLVNPGHHVVVAKAVGMEGQSEVDIAEKETKRVVIVLQPVAAAAAIPSATLTAPVFAPAPTPGASDSVPSRRGIGALTWIGVGVTGVGLGVGTVTGIMSLSATSSAQSACKNNLCPPSTHDDLESARTLATVSNIAFAAAGVGAAIFVVSLVVRGGEKPPATTTARVTPWFAPGSAGLVGSF